MAEASALKRLEKLRARVEEKEGQSNEKTDAQSRLNAIGHQMRQKSEQREMGAKIQQDAQKRLEELRMELNEKNLFNRGQRSLEEIEREMQYLKTGSDQLITDRFWNTVSGAGKSYGASFINNGGVLLEGLSWLNDRAFETNHESQIKAAQNSLEYWTEMLQSAKTEEERILAQEQVDRNHRILEGLDDLKESSSQYVDNAADAIYSASDALFQSAAEDIAKAKEDLGALGSFLVDTGVSGIQFAGDLGVGVFTGGTALVPAAVRSFGEATQQARLDGANFQQQLAYGVGNAALSIGTDKIFDWAKPMANFFGKDLADDILKKLPDKLMDSPAGRITLSALGEGVGDSMESIIQPLLANLTYGKEMDYSADAWADILRDALIGFVVGGIAGGVGEIPHTSVRRAWDGRTGQTAQTSRNPQTNPGASIINEPLRVTTDASKAHNAATIAVAAQVQLSAMGEADADGLSMAIAKAATGQRLTQTEKTALRTNQNAQAVLRQIQSRPWL